VSDIEHLFENNRVWARQMRAINPGYFEHLAQQQAPQYLWIGCSDSRVPANEITGLQPGEVFVHRNIGNVVVQTDLNCLSVIQFAVDVLRVGHIMVVGHYGCSGVQAALTRNKIGLSDNWLRKIENVALKFEKTLGAIADAPERLDRLCELNVIEQVVNVCRTTVLEEAWERGQELAVHGWVYGIRDGLLRDLNVTITGPGQWPRRYDEAVAAVLGCGDPEERA
jgi:carbonic anhydrase